MASVKLGAYRFGGALSTLKSINARSYHSYSPEPGHYIPGKEPKWVKAEEAMEVLKSDTYVYSQGAAATPIHLLNAMADRGKQCKLKNITVCHMHTEGPAKYCEKEYEGIFRSVSFFMGGNVRKAVAEGRADAIPLFLHEIPKLFYKKMIKPHIALIHVSPPDNHGYCSLGTSVDCARAALTVSKNIIAQVNPQMPRTFGDALIHISHIDYAVCHDAPLPEHGGGKISDIDKKIGDIIAAELVENGATLQMGIGGIPDAVLSSLLGHKDLGIHSEMFAGGVVDLVENGCVTNHLKPHHKGRTVGSFLNGTKKLYDFVNDNPSVEMLRVEYVNSVPVIATMPKMTAINSAIEVDLTGQVNADSIGTRMYSGFGGQVDFIRGAAEGLDHRGKPIIAIQSASKKGVSKIVPLLKPGAGVISSRAHVHWIVTEYGCVNLFGKPLVKRAAALIKIAHPDQREKLEKAAFERFKVMPKE